MTRAEEKALEAYPECPCYNDLHQEYQDINGEYRVGFEIGYEQAEKDLALTWEDIKKLDGIMDSMRTYTAWDAVDYPNGEDFYKEVLKRFNESKK